MKTKYLSLIILFMLFSILLTGCGNEGNELIGTASNNQEIVSVDVNSFSSDGIVEVAYGTSKSNALPQEVPANLSGGNKVEVPVNWDSGTPVYNSEQVGIYDFLGVLDLSNLNYKNPDNISLDVKVKVNEAELGSKYKPAQNNQKINYSFTSREYGKVNLTLEVTEIIDGEQARNMIIDEKKDKFLPIEKEYVVVKYNVTLESVEKESESSLFSLSPEGFNAISKNGVSYNNLMSGVELEAGESTFVYAGYLADILNEQFAVFNGEIWFDITK